MGMRNILDKIARRVDLTLEEAYGVARDMLNGIDEALGAAILMGLRVKGEVAEEIAGFAKALRDSCVRIPLGDEGVRFIDTAGTGGDGFGTLNASTIAALISAYLGAYVVKHGNRGVSSVSGSA
jgi:anthranilate phosphoribosyltransferase (EC 2.4.2.18)